LGGTDFQKMQGGLRRKEEGFLLSYLEKKTFSGEKATLPRAEQFQQERSL